MTELMRDFRTIHETLGELPDIKKIYLLGSTGAGKTSLVQSIIGTSQYGFPTTSHRRTTVAPTEYVIDRSLEFKTTIILKTKEDIENSIAELIEMAIIRALEGNLSIEEIVFELEQTPDERFKLKQIISTETFKEKAVFISTHIIPQLKGIEGEELFSKPNIKNEIDKISSDFIEEIENHFMNKCKSPYQLFSDEPYFIQNITDKDEFIQKNKELLANESGSISVLVEYIRIEGDLLADWLNNDLKFVLIDGEGIGHSLGEKRDTLSTRHHDYFNFCNKIVLVENSSEPFTTGGQGAIESIFLNGYRNKFKLVFSKIDKLSISDTNSYFRRNIRNLIEALKKEDIDFNIENKDTYKLSNLNKANIEATEKKEIEKLLLNINESSEGSTIPLEYDFNNLLVNLDREGFINEFQDDINPEHWAVIKAFSKRMLNREIEYKRIKPIGWLLRFIMQDINLFLRREDDLQSDISDSQNMIKQNFSKKIIRYIYERFILDKNHLWQQAFEKKGIGSDKERKKFIFEQILMTFLPDKENANAFNTFSNEIKSLLLESGAQELKSAIKISIDSIDIKKVYGKANFRWSLVDNVNILLGKNGSGKSTVIKLIDACINNNKEVFKQYDFPYVELTLSKEYENGDKQKTKISNSKRLPDIHSILISTFDILTSNSNTEETYLDLKLKELIDEFGKYQRSLTQIIAKKTEVETNKSTEIRNNIASANQEQLIKYKELIVSIDNVRAQVYKPINEFKEILDLYLNYNNKSAIVDDEKAPLLIVLKNEASENITINTNQLSSGEKQLLIIFLTVILQKDKPFILLMDEPETSLHVEWQSTLIDNIHRIRPNIQIIVATHNPLIALNRNQNEIGIIKHNEEEVVTDPSGTKYLDISSILLKYFELPSLIGKDMQKDINDFTCLKLKEQNEQLNATDSKELERISEILENSFAGEIIYNTKYFSFLKFLKENKGIDFDKLEKIDEDEFQSFLNDFGGEFND
jgi:ABC-type cobalamin/Fe3+-siderophores transport system ATPase subunit